MLAPVTVRNSDLRRLLDLALTLETAGDLATFRAMVLEGVAGVVATDSLAYQEIDAAAGEAVSEARPDEIVQPALIAELMRTIHQHPVWAAYERTGDGRALKLSDFMTRRELHRTELYNAVYRPLDVEYQMVIAGAGTPLVALIASRSSRDFGERDRAVLDLLRPHLLAARERVLQRQRDRAVIESFEHELAGRSAALVVLGRGDRVVSASPRAHALLAGVGYGCDGDRLAAPLLDWLPAARRSGATLDLDRGGDRVRARLVPGVPAAIVLEELGLPATHAELGLTRREAQVVDLAARGLSNKGIAAELTVSPRTVGNHLASIYRKLGVENRTAAVTAVLGAKAGPRRCSSPRS